jgi:hypothetical protein
MKWRGPCTPSVSLKTEGTLHMSKFLQIIPFALQMAKIVEAAVPLGGQGKAKLAFAVDAAGAAYQAEESLRESWKDKDSFLAAIAQTTTLAVALLNATGVFKKSTN